MTAQEANNKSLWYGLSEYVRARITDAIDVGRLYTTLDQDHTLHYDDHHRLKALGYYIYFNKTTNSHEIRW